MSVNLMPNTNNSTAVHAFGYITTYYYLLHSGIEVRKYHTTATKWTIELGRSEFQQLKVIVSPKRLHILETKACFRLHEWYFQMGYIAANKPVW